ncbi:MAG: flagellar biosynthetic protein FliR [Mobilicoccus sp.]|nr:flagellar biosynthetic protein FliR [Mobilicoccus sp.]
MEVELALQSVYAFILVMVRIVAFLVIAPPFNSTSLPLRVKGMMAAAIALPLTPQFIGDVAAITSLANLVTAVVWQIIAGLSVGLVVLILFSAVQMAGMYIDYFSMFAMSAMLDPVTGSQTSIFGRIYNWIAVALLFASGGHLLLLRGLLQTFEIIPAAAIDMGRIAEILVGNLDRMVMSALQIGAPILAVLFLTDLSLGLVSRAVPSLNVFQLAFPVKTLLVVSLATLAVAMMPGAVETVIGGILRQFPAVLDSVGG